MLTDMVNWGCSERICEFDQIGETVDWVFQRPEENCRMRFHRAKAMSKNSEKWQGKTRFYCAREILDRTECLTRKGLRWRESGTRHERDWERDNV